MRNLILLLSIPLIFSCKNKEQNKIKHEENKPLTEISATKKPKTKLELLQDLPKDSLLKNVDLSHENLTEFPDLADRKIERLNLSHNELDSLVLNRLPKNLKTIDLSYNRFTNDFELPRNQYLKKLFQLDLSHNQINRFYFRIPTARVIISYNDLTYVSLGDNSRCTQYLDISNNKNLSNVIGNVMTYQIDTIKHENIANDLPITSALEKLAKEGID
ncbi:hypothetical protein ACT4R9_06925 [Ornithobacterium rhinotracheale]|uniref:hypothetical protein n=1 Tax=Ornithobacterium rhinotracheale TaxID=28251 RepID=UPI003FA4164F